MAAMLIDIHAHFGQVVPGTVPPARLATYAGVSEVDHLLVSNRDAAVEPAGVAVLDETEANGVCLAACEKQARFVPVYWVRPGRPDSNVFAFGGALTSEAFVGAVFSPAASGFDAGDEAVEPYLSVLAKIGKPAMFCVSDDERAAPGKIYDQARKHRGLAVVLCACGAGDVRRAECLEVARRGLQKGDATIYLDTSHANAGEVRGAVEALGPGRVMYGTNALVFGDSHVPRHITLLDELRRTMTTVVYQQITGGTAQKLFCIGTQGTG
jgi:predicted TIM-barrel fold metal-dependent hydrolase